MLKKNTPQDIVVDETPDTFDEEAVSEFLDSMPEEDSTDLYKLSLQVMKDALTGLRIMKKTKQPQLNKGQAAEWKLDTPDGEVWVYQMVPDVKLAQFIAKQKEGKPGTKEITAKATTVVFRACVPGHDEEIKKHLALLSDDKLSKYKFDDETQAAIMKARESNEE